MIFAVVGMVEIGVLIFCCWTLWSAAVTVPLRYRMRWPWMIWLLLLPIPFLNDILCFIVLLPLTRSYQRFFQDHRITQNGRCGFLVAFFVCIAITLVNLLDCAPNPTTSLQHASPLLARLLALAPNISQWIDVFGSIAWVALLLIVWRLHRQARDINSFTQKNDLGAALRALESYVYG